MLPAGRQDKDRAVTLAFGLLTLYSEIMPHTVKQVKHATSHTVSSLTVFFYQ